MASPPTSRLRFLSLEGEPVAAPPEWAPCQVEIRADPSDWADLQLTRNTEELPISLTKVAGMARVIAEWPRAGAGRYLLRLRHPDWIETLDCAVRPEKLSETAFEQLLVDLQQRLPATIAIALQQAGALTGLNLVAPQETTLAEELNRLTRACEGSSERAGLIKLMRAIARQPHRVLQATDVWTRRERARRIDPTRLYQAYARRSNLTLGLVPLQVPEKRVEHTVDVYENRVLRTYFDQVNTRLRSLRRAASQLTSGSVASRALALLEDLTRARLEASFLDEVTELNEPPTRLTMVLLRRSEYRAALEGFLEFRRSALVQLDEPLLAAPLENLPKLYESWGTLQVIATFANLAPSLGYTVERQDVVHRRADRVWVEVLKDGKPAVVLKHPSGQTAKLLPQFRYPSGGSGLHSVSFPKKPDISVEIEDPDGNTEIWIFDPKYKLDSETQPASDETGDDIPSGSPKPQDINAMHAYRDAIRDGANRHVVRFAGILYPGATRDFGAELAALQAQPLIDGDLGASLSEILATALRPRVALEAAA
jgi:hypothetical protein